MTDTLTETPIEETPPSEEDAPIEHVVTVLADPAIDLDKMMLDEIDTSAGPLYSVSEMARFFFARSPHWVRWLETCDYKVPDPDREGRMMACGKRPERHSGQEAEEHRSSWRLTLDGVLLEPIRTQSNARKYDLQLIEKIAHALASNSTIKASQLRQALKLVKIQAEMHEYLET